MPLLIIPLALVVAFLWLVFRKRPVRAQAAVLVPRSIAAADTARTISASAVKSLPSTSLARSR
ncbi:MAG TPA: hypothetical protein VGO62_19120 [Myxococcota bacterium]|jgi:hypothetical protein